MFRKSTPSLYALMFTLLLAAACSSKKEAKIGSGPETESQISKEDEILNAALEDNGVINFFEIRGVEKGLVVRNIQWGQPVTSDNPGADCELKRKGNVAPNSPVAFACVVRESGFEAVVLTLTQEVKEGKAALRRITMDGKGTKQREFWMRSAQKLGFSRKVGAKPVPNRSFWVSPDKKTDLTVVWNEAAQAVTLIFAPAS